MFFLSFSFICLLLLFFKIKNQYLRGQIIVLLKSNSCYVCWWYAIFLQNFWTKMTTMKKMRTTCNLLEILAFLKTVDGLPAPGMCFIVWIYTYCLFCYLWCLDSWFCSKLKATWIITAHADKGLLPFSQFGILEFEDCLAHSFFCIYSFFLIYFGLDRK